MTLDLESLFSLIVAAAVPFFVGFVTAKTWNPFYKWLLVIAASVAIALVTIAVQPGTAWTWENIGAIVGTTIALSHTVYLGIIRQLPAVQQWLDDHGVGKPPTP
jgi:uncharacterized membrane protein